MFQNHLTNFDRYDSPFHLAEECSNANVASPRAIVMTSATGGIFGWCLQLVVAYTVVNIDDVISSDLGQPYAAYLIQCMPQKIALAILALTIVAGFFMGQAWYVKYPANVLVVSANTMQHDRR